MNYFEYSYSTSSTTTIFIFIFILLNIIARWRLFTKARRWGISAFIPIYSDIALCRIVKLSPLWLLFLLIPLVNMYFIIFYHIVISFKLSFAFGKGIMFGLGLLVFNPLFILILGLGIVNIVTNKNRYKLSFVNTKLIELST